MTDHCANPKCGKELIHTPGRRKKKYCGQKCNIAHWQALNPIPKKRAQTIKLPEDFKIGNKVGILKADGTIEELTTVDQLPENMKMSFRAVNELMSDLTDTGAAIVEHTKEGSRRIDPFSEEGNEVKDKLEKEDRIKKIEEQLKLPSKFLPLNRKKQLESELKSLKK